MNILRLTLVFLAFLPNLYSQEHAHCGADEATQLLLNEHPELIQAYEKADSAVLYRLQNNLTSKSSAVVYTVPVVVHVIYNSEFDNISKTQILDAIRVLNEDFRRMNADKGNTRSIFQPVAADVEVEFQLAKLDPQGNCTDGINRVQSSASIAAANNVKNIIQWDNDKYLNIWVVNSISLNNGPANVLGYAYRPQFNQSYYYDGVVIRHDRMGTIGTANTEGAGRTLTHEVGHYLGLQHPFNDGCNGGDGVADTPPVASASFGCNLSRNSCNNDSPDLPDMIENYMDYADGICQNVFTLGQRNVIRTNLEVYGLRGQLKESSNHTETGLSNPPACQMTALVGMEQQPHCPGDLVQLYDFSENGDPDTWKWYFENGQPATSTNQNPQVSFSAAGNYDVSLVVSNAAGKDSIFLDDYISVKPYWTNYQSQWIEGFESGLDSPNMTILSQEDDFKFKLSTQVGMNSNQSLFIDNYNSEAFAFLGSGNGAGDIDQFVSPQIFTIFGSGLLMTFDYAFAAQTNDDNDILRILASDDCGETWTQVRLFTGGTLRTTTNVSGTAFVPNSSAQWRNGFVPLAAFDNGNPIVVKFEFKNGGGNNLYIDNINLAATNVSLDEEMIAEMIAVYPNPSNGQIEIAIPHGLSGDVNVQVNDLYGRSVYADSYESVETSKAIDLSHLATGVYIITLNGGPINFTEKIVIE